MKPAPAATPSTSQSCTSRRRVRPGAISASAHSGANLPSSSTTGATTICAAASLTTAPAAAVRWKESRATAPAHGIESANTPDTWAQDTVLARAIQNQHTMTHRQPIHAPRIVRVTGEIARAAPSTARLAQVMHARIRSSAVRHRDRAARPRSLSHHSRRTCGSAGAGASGAAGATAGTMTTGLPGRVPLPAPASGRAGT